MDIQKRGLKRKSKVCTLDTQIKRSGLRISHSKVFSSDYDSMVLNGHGETLKHQNITFIKYYDNSS